MAENIRVGIIGGNVNGWAGRAHMPAMAAGIPGVELIAVSTTRQESADEAAAKFGAKYAYDNHRNLLANPEVDVAAVVVKLPTHYELTKDVIAAGKHVYTEWPLGTTMAQAEEMTDLAAAAGVRTCVGLQARHSAQYREIRRLIDSGAIGDVLTASVTQFASGALARPSARIWMRDGEAHANTLTITFGHAIDGLLSMLGPARSIASAVSTQTREWTASDTGERFSVDSPDTVLVSGALASGAAFSMHVASVAAVGTGHSVQIHGSRGTITLDSPSSTHTSPGELRVALEGETALRTVVPPQDEWVTATGIEGGSVNIGKLWASYADAILNDREFHPDFADAVHHHRLMDAVQRASDTGRMQEV
ncbi:MAG: Gfo/Idh/MocA family oxidoreductase [Chloroflexi bacterium]|nr:Gfo/Idh/MocA family oxidoreductase [Chloroflexota bacterium]